MTDKHPLRILIFNDTLAVLRQGGYVAPSGRKVTLPPVEEVMRAAMMYSNPIELQGNPAGKVEAVVRVEDKDCVQAAMDLIDAGYNPAMLNLADLYVPGGLVEYGSGAQEENLCRRSNLILSLYQFSRSRVRQYPDMGLVNREEQYPMDERFGGVYSGIVTFFRESESHDSQLMEKPYNIPVISVAALSGPRIGSDGLMYPEETAITLDKMRTIFRIGMDHGHDSLVLSAMGCGAFHNPPAHIARLFHQVMGEAEFERAYRLVDFAILDGYKTGLRHNPEGNLLPFQREFGETSFYK